MEAYYTNKDSLLAELRLINRHLDELEKFSIHNDHIFDDEIQKIIRAMIDMTIKMENFK